MKVLIVGSGGREHALAWKLKQSPMVGKIYVAPGNAGINLIANCINIKIDDIKELANFAERHHIDLTVVGPELPLTIGVVDEFNRRNLKIFGPTRAAAELEGSKAFAKEFMRKHHIPTAPFQKFTQPTDAASFVKTTVMPIVIKASGLAAGKGAVVVRSYEEANHVIEEMMVKKIFGEAGDTIVIENFLEGQELSVMAFCDGANIKMMLPSQDHKPIGEGDTGPNTGGMGAYCPATFVDEATMALIRDHIIDRAVLGMAKEGRLYKGVLYAGLMLTDNGPKVVEFNCRFGDPETQAVLPLLKSDLADIMIAVIEGHLNSIDDLKWEEGAASCVVLASKGYPQKAETGKRIFGLRNYSDRNCQLFHAGTRRNGKNWFTAGGRVIGVTSVDTDLKSSLAKAYDVINAIKFDGMYYRTDIGSRANIPVKISRI
nr:phosphoribosylamine--glycine ligase [candidate division Zixibacteria bacterium]